MQKQQFYENSYVIFWKTLEMLLINCEINLIRTWSKNCFICAADRAKTFAITDKKHYVLVVTLSTQIMQNYHNN